MVARGADEILARRSRGRKRRRRMLNRDLLTMNRIRKQFEALEPSSQKLCLDWLNADLAAGKLPSASAPAQAALPLEPKK
jgi:hypothetical protein